MKFLKVSAKIKSPVSLTYDLLLDSLLITSKARGMNLSDKDFDLDNPVTLEQEIAYIKDMPLCSRAFFVNERESFEKIYKRADWDNDKFSCSKKIGTGSGKYKNYMMPLKIFYAEEVYFYCVGDEEKIKKLLENVHAIGKKTNAGYGILGDFEVKECDEISFIDTENPLRPIPVKYFPESKGKKQIKTYKFPYFYKKNEELCFV